ncbi:MAG TPA: hypothetical protein VIV35_11300 [Chitinophagaceae bacterium]
MKKISAIFLSCCFLVNCVMVPFCNFQDTVSAKILYSQFLQRDSDGDVFEFITNNILNIGSLIGDDDDDDDDQPQQQIPVSQQHQQPIQITPGFLYCAQSLMPEEKEQAVAPRVFCSFIDNNYKLYFSSFIFHPPAAIC